MTGNRPKVVKSARLVADSVVTDHCKPCISKQEKIKKEMLKLKQDLVKVFKKYICHLSTFNFINHSLFHSTVLQFSLQPM